MRLQKYMAECGVASRRKCEELIAGGKVHVNGKRVEEMGFKIDPAIDVVTYKGKIVEKSSEKIYIMLNKPAGVICSVKDDKNRETVMDYVREIKERIFPVGRLDFISEGLLIMTNDGELANGLTHPKNNVSKSYLSVIDSDISEEEIKNLENGVLIDGYKTAKAIFHAISVGKKRSEILCVIREGKNRQIRKMFEAIGKNVVYLKRVAVGDLKLENLKKGTYRHLTYEEVEYLKRVSD